MREINYEEYKKSNGIRLRQLLQLSENEPRRIQDRPRDTGQDRILIMLDYIQGQNWEKEGKLVYEGNHTFTYRLKI